MGLLFCILLYLDPGKLLTSFCFVNLFDLAQPIGPPSPLFFLLSSSLLSRHDNRMKSCLTINLAVVRLR